MQHTKLKRLVRALKVPQYAAVGILESLWHLTAREAPEGNIGRLSNEDIAAWIDWEGSADELISSLIAAGWIDEVAESRLEVHDWFEHADDATKLAIKRRRAKVLESVGQTPTGKDKTPLPEPEPEPLPEPVPEPVKVSKATPSHPDSIGALTTIHHDLAIYEAYPRKEGKGAALEAIRKSVVRLVKGEEPHAPMDKLGAQRYLMRRVLEYGRSPAGMQPDKTKIPHPATWFNQKRYDDDQANWRFAEAFSGNRNQSKTAGNLDAAAQAIALLEARDREVADEVRRTSAGPGESVDPVDVRGRLIELPTPGH